MVEYETIGIIVIIVGLLSAQIKLSVDQGNKEHDRLDKRITEKFNHLEKKINKIADKMGVLF